MAERHRSSILGVTCVQVYTSILQLLRRTDFFNLFLNTAAYSIPLHVFDNPSAQFTDVRMPSGRRSTPTDPKFSTFQTRTVDAFKKITQYGLEVGIMHPHPYHASVALEIKGDPRLLYEGHVLSRSA